MRRLLLPALLLAVLLSLPVWSPRIFWLNVAAQALIFAIFAMSLDLLLGYGGMPSFGHAAFYGGGAYACAFWALHRGPDLLPMLGAGLLAGGLLALPIGALSLRARGIYFLMLTLAFGQMLWAFISNNQLRGLLGGDFGLIGVGRPVVPGADRLGWSLWIPANFYFLVLALAALTFLMLSIAVRAPFGRSLEGVRENEHRMQALGYPTFRYRLAAFVAAGALAGVAGALAAAYNLSATPGQLYWTTSGLVLIATIVGGTRTLVGPVLGALLVVFMQVSFSLLVIGLIFIAFVLFLPTGVMGLGDRRALARLRRIG